MMGNMNEFSLPREELILEVLQKYSDTIYRLAFSRTKSVYDAEDIMQNVFMRFMKCNINFESDEHIKAWLIRVTINLSKNLLTSAWFKRTTVLEDNIITTIKEESEVYKYVLDLPTKYRTVIHLFYYEDMTTANISEVLNVKESTVRSQLHRARNMLKEIIEGDECFEF
ncbi:sigma-70 family RNA polymerase sigma factor [Clostridium sp. AL.422]|uniref:sigma-70 family RNA polymerase sigma factor n=1 Tax=Clostridium TaxID=1485 RepID=UPI00293DE8F1|nr:MULTISPECIES: sigma-70 family RNA polymerase sigma factor [unclassified Clostridium]MDV4152086.1 sigma-70 family RNA polymerase sigma factor [Clostridium sp. AL.422]